ncbi:Endoribonuclease L-PSP [Acaromyces ingoldii]|uniref:Endoribonuclease L-PSP n=1 Tax=Acaromyces ingoldii TaxID=215250 RepID=A0A316YFG5_9BASI|nr:Endoribonuclease L-PSP [Acaromyces ingoldii]PWN86823.1 Endoribonuclease L-PSP [Acaromyces ingoldii]
MSAHIGIRNGPARFIGAYSDGVVVSNRTTWLYTAGTPGLDESGKTPEGIEAQSRLAWENIFAILKKADMDASHLVKVTTWLTSEDLVKDYVRVRSEFIGENRPAFMLGTVNSLIRDDILVEIEIVAAK